VLEMHDAGSVSMPTEAIDCIVIGAGINGLAVARDAVARGLRVIVVERDDLCAGTSGTSSKLIHGGLRYLERFDLGLILESIRESDILFRMAPHLVRPYPILVPFYADNSRPGALIRLGLVAYDMMRVGRNHGRARSVSKESILRRWPGMSADGLQGGATFVDGQVAHTERLCVEQALDSERLGARILTHTRVDHLILENDRVVGVAATDAVGRTLEIRAPLTINAAGPWVDRVLGAEAGGRRLVGGTKGSHVVVDPFPGAPDICVFYEAPSDHRPVWIFPWNGRYILGTTDLAFEGDLDEVAADESEFKYLLDSTNRLLPKASLAPSDVLYSFSGIRPLPFTPAAKTNSHISRAHSVIDHRPAHPGLLSIVGGKLTTHRALGEDVVDKALQVLGRKHLGSTTRSRPLPGADTPDWPAFVEDFRRRSPLPRLQSERLLDVYGVRGECILDLIAAEPDLASVIDEDTGAVAAEIVLAVREEGAVTLADILLRRTLIGQNGDVGLAASRPCAAVAVRHLGWTEDRAESEIEAYVREVRRFRPRALPADAGPVRASEIVTAR
jgi:glycerol-3-phosphate dehydrogenase